MLPFSLAKAMTEPVKVTAPMARPRRQLDQGNAVDGARRTDAVGFPGV
jgi:hypothetical protein